MEKLFKNYLRWVLSTFCLGVMFLFLYFILISPVHSEGEQKERVMWYKCYYDGDNILKIVDREEIHTLYLNQ